jgi:hypothetical protein
VWRRATKEGVHPTVVPLETGDVCLMGLREKRRLPILRPREVWSARSEALHEPGDKGVPT